MAQILIVENDPRDVQFAAQCAVQCGFSEVVRSSSAEAAQILLEKTRSAEGTLPDAILLDLDLGLESGFDLLRVRYETSWMMEIPLVVWTRLAGDNEKYCGVFKVQGYVQKSAGEYGLYKALESLRTPPAQKI